MKDKVSWSDRRLVIVLKMVLEDDDPNDTYWYVTDCTGVVSDDRNLWVADIELPFSTVPKGNEKGFILDHARPAGVFCQRIGLFDDGVIRRNPRVQLGDTPAQEEQSGA